MPAAGATGRFCSRRAINDLFDTHALGIVIGMHILVGVEHRHSRRRRDPEPSGALAMGAIMAGAAALAGAALAAAGGHHHQRPKLKVAGLDLSGVDLRRPFFVDFSVAPHASMQVKWEAMRRLREASEEFSRTFPAWICEPEVQVKDGRFVLTVTPIDHPAQQVSRRLMAP